MKKVKILVVLLIIISCSSCSGKLWNQLNWWLGEKGIEKYYDVWGDLHKESFHFVMEAVYHKYSETHITLEILQQMEQTDTVLENVRPSLKELQYSSQENYSKLASYDSIPVKYIPYYGKGYWYVYRLKSPSTNNVFVLSLVDGGMLCVHIASNNYKPVYLKDLTFAEEKTLEKEFETELLPKIEEFIRKVKYLHKYRIWREDLE